MADLSTSASPALHHNSTASFDTSEWPSASSSAPLPNPEDDNIVTVVWGGEKLRFELPPPDAPLSEFRQALAERTGVFPENQKLILGGAVMQKDLPLKTYGLVRQSLSDEAQFQDESKMPSLGLRNLLSKWGLGNSAAAGKPKRELKITMIGSKETRARVSDRAPDLTSSAPPPSLQPVPSSLDEPRVIAQIDSLIDNTFSKLKPTLDNIFAASKSTQPAPEAVKQQHAYVSEMLLQALLKLDGFNIDAKWAEARKARKEGIRNVQNLLDKVDALREGRAVPVEWSV